MVKVDDYEVPKGLYYHKEFGWTLIEDRKARIGITDYAQMQLREIVFVELPSVGDTVTQNEPFGTVESVKAVSDLVAPLSGTIEKVNEEVQNKPETLNEDPYKKGWLLIVSPSNLNKELKTLMDFDKAVGWHKKLIKEGAITPTFGPEPEPYRPERKMGETVPAKMEATIALIEKRLSALEGEVREKQTKCPRCNADMPSHARFCGVCGAELKKA